VGCRVPNVDLIYERDTGFKAIDLLGPMRRVWSGPTPSSHGGIYPRLLPPTVETLFKGQIWTDRLAPCRRERSSVIYLSSCE
jgi:hypothetical protein